MGKNKIGIFFQWKNHLKAEKREMYTFPCDKCSLRSKLEIRQKETPYYSENRRIILDNFRFFSIEVCTSSETFAPEMCENSIENEKLPYSPPLPFCPWLWKIEKLSITVPFWVIESPNIRPLWNESLAYAKNALFFSVFLRPSYIFRASLAQVTISWPRANGGNWILVFGQAADKVGMTNNVQITKRKKNSLAGLR